MDPIQEIESFFGCWCFHDGIENLWSSGVMVSTPTSHDPLSSEEGRIGHLKGTRLCANCLIYVISVWYV
jgi:hypothetical protein